MDKVIKSRKFWFGLVLPVAIQTVALLLKVIDAPTYIAALTATTGIYTGSVAYEDGEQAKATGGAPRNLRQR